VKRMFKVISPMDKRDGSGVWWLRCGNAYVNKDNSINVYLDAVPVPQKDGGVKLQLRELTEEDLRESREKRASGSSSSSGSSSYSARGTVQGSFAPDAIGTFMPPTNDSAAADGVPF